MTEPDATPLSASSVPEPRATDGSASMQPTSAAPAHEEQAGHVLAPEVPRADASASEVPSPEVSAPRAPPPGTSVPEVRLPGAPAPHVPPSRVPPPRVAPSKTAAPDGPSEKLPEPPSPPPPRHGLAWLAAAAIVVLALLQAALWVRVLVPPPGSAPLDQRVQAIEARVAALERRPAPVAAAQPGPVAAAQPGPAAAVGPGGPAATGAAADLGPLQARIAALEQRPLPAPAPKPDDSLAPRLTADEARLATLEKTAELPAQLADRANRVARIQAAFIALSAGRPLGDLPGAPPALARYATTAPPTEAALRLGFPAAAQAALAADHPAPGDKPFMERIWAEAQDLVTIRQGERVLVGDPAAGVLAHAQTALDAGDLAGAAASVGSLSGPAAQALAAWLDQARGLLAARAALADLAAQT